MTVFAKYAESIVSDKNIAPSPLAGQLLSQGIHKIYYSHFCFFVCNMLLLSKIMLKSYLSKIAVMNLNKLCYI